MMKTFGILLILGLLPLWTKLSSVHGHKPGYTWVCPRTPYVCIRAEPDECKSDLTCKGRKCCDYACAKRCVEPVKEKYGVCPPDYTRCAALESDQCTSDSDCKGDKKCCFWQCAHRCVPPLKGESIS
ncbi:WAP four-disulfide core domain protein 5-like [Sphaerodactylus townsendi]|uniref:WAP four-disulfide core domain protein 5-like n=1 Tax=Sphaerodactylus townsendi TaxID=933632 RepID=UPI0020261202|nr:WAP four-disulfide core domain protein 5-like [Sphaerodactylus townsendi]